MLLITTQNHGHILLPICCIAISAESCRVLGQIRQNYNLLQPEGCNFLCNGQTLNCNASSWPNFKCFRHTPALAHAEKLWIKFKELISGTKFFQQPSQPYSVKTFLSHISEDKYSVLEGTTRYAGFLLTPAEGFGFQIILIKPSANACVYMLTCPPGKHTCK